jgi:predicted XRE-type DNA-binding protein
MTRPNDLTVLRAVLQSQRRIDPATGCWVWTGAVDSRGYGTVKLSGRQIAVHRLSAHFHLGMALDSREWVLHSCDNPPCFFPDHLFLGTAEANVQDMFAKGRSRNGTTKLTETDVREIRLHWASGKVSQAELARHYGVQTPAINKIVQGKTWKHLTEQERTT